MARRFLLHVLPSGFHRIRHYGLFAGAVLADTIARARQLLAPSNTSAESAPADADGDAEPASSLRRCPCCGGRRIVAIKNRRRRRFRRKHRAPTAADAALARRPRPSNPHSRTRQTAPYLPAV